ncbi:MAG: GNAT family N-acetyltransferase [Pseudomonadota bacterium]
MTGFTLRAPRDGDGADIADLYNQPKVIDGTLRMPFTPETGLDDWLSGTNATRRFVIAEGEGRAVGFIRLLRHEGRMSHVGDLFLAVHDNWHGRGIGRALMKAALDVADNWMGLVRLQLEVFTGNAAAIRLYESLGFQTEGRARAGTICNGEFVDHFYMARLAPPLVRSAADQEENP